jgi:hypothetical protein
MPGATLRIKMNWGKNSIQFLIQRRMETSQYSTTYYTIPIDYIIYFLVIHREVKSISTEPGSSNIVDKYWHKFCVELPNTVLLLLPHPEPKD